MPDKKKQILYLIPSTLGESDMDQVLPGKVIDIIQSLNHFVVENERSARRFLIKTGYQRSISSVAFYLLNEHTEKKDIPLIFDTSSGADLGLLAEAGVPAVADPGTELVMEAHSRNITIVPLVGPSSVLLAVMASGLNGQNFSFNGYLPIRHKERIKRIKHLERKSKMENQPQVCIEAPYRNNQLISTFLHNCHQDTMLCIAANLTMKTEWIRTRTIMDWRQDPPDLNRQPAVFIIHSRN